MKKFILSISFFTTLLFSGFVFAQIPVVSKVLPDPMLGLKLGANFSKLSTSGKDMADSYAPGSLPEIGAFASIRKGSFGLRVEGLINFSNYDYSIGGAKNGTFNFVYLDIPVLLEYKLISRIWAQAGIQFSHTLSVKYTDNAVPKPEDLFKPNSYSGIIGVEARLPVHFILGARYVLGLTDMNNSSVSGTTNTWNSRTAQIYLGFRFI